MGLTDILTVLDSLDERERRTLDLVLAGHPNKAIGRQLDELIRAASLNVAKLQGSQMRENQIRNVVDLAARSESMEEVTNFIRYQIGRRDTGKSWSHGSFGKSVIGDIETGAVPSALANVIREVPLADVVFVRSRLIALFLGYLNRCFVYADKSGDWRNLSSNPSGEAGDQRHV